ncbi:AMP-binding protein [Kyrpidia sp.]|uniref:AMP-binding protein n=1 Tax=Kyrpidia sp. TaxID=2073077 RepID=UPI0025840356|nr:AMP-binding protein [Kyrpidia sp.]MCL6576782.1 AMP-binding protein [Kyrpidia sp.]
MKKLVVHELLRHTLLSRPESEIVSGDVRLPYAQMYDRVVRLADRLGRMGVGRGTVVGVLDVNSHRYLELHYALSMLGAVIHTLNFRLAAEDLAYTIRHAEDEWIFAWKGFAEAVRPLRSTVSRWVWMGDGADPEDGALTYEALVAEGRLVEPDVADRIDEADPYSIFYTTGTTGRPKGLMYRHRDVILASLQIAHHLALYRTGASVGTGDVFMPLIPFFHIHGWGSAIFVPYLGAKLVLPGRAGPAEQLALIRREGVTWSNMVPTQMQMLLDAAGDEPLGLKVLTGGSPLSSGLAQAARDRGVTYSLIYGGSDQLGASISVVPEHVDPTSAEAGRILATRTRPLPMVEIEVRDREGLAVPRDGKTIGEVWVRSPWLPQGYYNDPERTRESYVDGWFRSGDLAVLEDDGTLYVVDREKDAVKSGGEWIPCGVLESLLSEHPKVIEAVVVAKPDERWGERPLAVIRPRTPISPEELRAYLGGLVDAGKLTKFWVPDDFVFLDNLPVTSAGKVHKVSLRKMLGLA